MPTPSIFLGILNPQIIGCIPILANPKAQHALALLQGLCTYTGMILLGERRGYNLATATPFRTLRSNHTLTKYPQGLVDLNGFLKISASSCDLRICFSACRDQMET